MSGSTVTISLLVFWMMRDRFTTNMIARVSARLGVIELILVLWALLSVYIWFVNTISRHDRGPVVTVDALP